MFGIQVQEHLLSYTGSKDAGECIMSIGANLLVNIFEAFAENDTAQKTMRRLYCESGQAGVKAYRFVNDTTKKRLDEIIPKCECCKHSKLQTMTAVLVYNELAKNDCLDLLKEMYIQIRGKSNKAYRFCNKTTQNKIQKLGLYNTQNQARLILNSRESP